MVERTVRVGRRTIHIVVDGARVYVGYVPTASEKALRALRRWWDGSWASWVVEGTTWAAFALLVAWGYGLMMEYPHPPWLVPLGAALVITLSVGAASRWGWGLREKRTRHER